MSIVVTACWLITLGSTSAPKYQQRYHTTPVDHFDADSPSFELRYLVPEKEQLIGDSASPRPIFLYTGNEGPIEQFWNSIGFVHEISPQFSAVEVNPCLARLPSMCGVHEI